MTGDGVELLGGTGLTGDPHALQRGASSGSLGSYHRLHHRQDRLGSLLRDHAMDQLGPDGAPAPARRAAGVHQVRLHQESAVGDGRGRGGELDWGDGYALAKGEGGVVHRPVAFGNPQQTRRLVGESAAGGLAKAEAPQHLDVELGTEGGCDLDRADVARHAQDVSGAELAIGVVVADHLAGNREEAVFAVEDFFRGDGAALESRRDQEGLEGRAGFGGVEEGARPGVGVA